MKKNLHQTEKWFFNKIFHQKIIWLSSVLMRCLRVTLISYCLILIISETFPLSLSTASLVSFLLLIFLWKTHPVIQKNFIKKEDVSLFFDFTDKSNKNSPYQIFNNKDSYKIFSKNHENINLSFKKHYRRKLQKNILHSLIPLGMALGLSYYYPLDFGKLREDHLIKNTTEFANLKIIKGSKKIQKKYFDLLDKKHIPNIYLSLPNLVHIKIKTTQANINQSILLKDLKSNHTIRSFKISKTDHDFSIKFQINQSSSLYIPHISTKNLAKFDIEKQSLPIISIASQTEITNPWPDNIPLKLKIKANGLYPFEKISIIVEANNKKQTEDVETFEQKKTKHFIKNHNLELQQFIEGDYNSLTIYAEVIDKKNPKPQRGYSNTIKLNVLTSYARYILTLKSLNKLKEKIDQHLISKNYKKPVSLQTSIQDISEKASNTPFFDLQDRYFIESLKNKLHTPDNYSNLSDEISDFLEEHEFLNDRERDRDYFVAMRYLSNLIYHNKKKHIKDSILNLKKFLDKRFERWAQRIQRINSEQIKNSWENIKLRPFKQDLEQILEYSKNNEDPQKSLDLVTMSTNLYKAWLQELEGAEDQDKIQKEKERKKQLPSIQKKLKKLQKNQDDISNMLDKSEQRNNSEHEETWPIARMKQNDNIAESKSLTKLINSLFPNAYTRLHGAKEAMEKTLEAGQEQDYTYAESQSDRASRLLRETQKKLKQKQKKHIRRRKRTSGNDYYGDQINKVDIKILHEYEVDKKYRQNILNEVYQHEYEPESKKVIDNYLRKIIR